MKKVYVLIETRATDGTSRVFGIYTSKQKASDKMNGCNMWNYPNRYHIEEHELNEDKKDEYGYEFDC